jgi:hypothetical protein
MMQNLELYAVQSKDGKWLRRKGYGGSGACWVEDVNKARIYPKIGGARSMVTWWANNYPQYGVPSIVKLTISAIEVIDESKRVEKAKNSREKKEIAYKIIHKQEEMKRLQEQIKNAENNLNKLKSN